MARGVKWDLAAIKGLASENGGEFFRMDTGESLRNLNGAADTFAREGHAI